MNDESFDDSITPHPGDHDATYFPGEQHPTPDQPWPFDVRSLARLLMLRARSEIARHRLESNPELDDADWHPSTTEAA